MCATREPAAVLQTPQRQRATRGQASKIVSSTSSPGVSFVRQVSFFRRVWPKALTPHKELKKRVLNLRSRPLLVKLNKANAVSINFLPQV